MISVGDNADGSVGRFFMGEAAVCKPPIIKSFRWSAAAGPKLGLPEVLLLPCATPRHTQAGAPKRDAGLQIASPEHELRRLLGLAGFAEPVAVEPVEGTRLDGREALWREFGCRRSNGEGRRAANGEGYGFRIEFPEPVQGPVAVGYASHFGMGGFEAVDSLQSVEINQST
ncbi:Uncharacterised protein [uncultured archaeon]|nr:Uncharacterised protein [uncultured archaeon]